MALSTPNVKENIITKFTKTAEGWQKIVFAMEQPLRIRASYHTVEGKLMIGIPAESVPVQTYKTTVTVSPLVKDIDRIQDLLAKTVNVRTEEPFFTPLCSGPKVVTENELREIFESTEYRGNVVLNAITFSRMIKKFQHKTQPDRFLSDGRYDLGVRGVYITPLIPQGVVLNFKLDSDKTGGFQWVGWPEKPWLTLLTTRDTKNGLEADIGLEISWRVDAPLGAEALLLTE